MTKPDLLPCPFCGGEASLTTYGWCTIRCRSCTIEMFSDDNNYSREFVTLKWNTRADLVSAPSMEKPNNTGSTPLITHYTDDRGNKMIGLAEWYFRELTAALEQSEEQQKTAWVDLSGANSALDKLVDMLVDYEHTQRCLGRSIMRKQGFKVGDEPTLETTRKSVLDGMESGNLIDTLRAGLSGHLSTGKTVPTMQIDAIDEAIYLLDRACQFKTNDTQEEAMKDCIAKLEAIISKTKPEQNSPHLCSQEQVNLNKQVSLEDAQGNGEIMQIDAWELEEALRRYTNGTLMFDSEYFDAIIKVARAYLKTTGDGNQCRPYHNRQR